MSSISEKIAENIVKNDGYYTDEDGEQDPRCFAVFKMRNSYFGHVHPVVAYSLADYMRYHEDHHITEFLWVTPEWRKILMDEDKGGEK